MPFQVGTRREPCAECDRVVARVTCLSYLVGERAGLRFRTGWKLDFGMRFFCYGLFRITPFPSPARDKISDQCKLKLYYRTARPGENARNFVRASCGPDANRDACRRERTAL